MADIFNMTDTWNDAGVTFSAIKMDVTDTASDAGSNLLDLQVGGVSKASINKNGTLLLPEQSVPSIASLEHPESGIVFDTTAGKQRIRIGNGAFSVDIQAQLICTDNITTNSTAGKSIIGHRSLELIDGTGSGPVLTRDADEVFAQRNSTNAQTFNIYNTYTDASNYERARMGWSGDAYEIKPEAAGTGTVRELHISGLPTTDPAISGVLWNDAGTVKVSA